MIFALAGNQNCGKTTLFNVLTGSNQHVGNFPGVTVDQKIGVIKGTNDKCDVVDLPGIYSLRPYTQEEIVTRDFIVNEKPDAIINIVDATNIERNLYLTLQLLELQVPTVLALNMMDELRANGGTIDVEKLSGALGIPVVPISAVKNEGVAELIDHAVEAARGKVLPQVTDFCEAGSPVHRAIHAVIHLIQDHADRLGIPARFCATKLIEGDSRMDDELALDQNEKELLEHLIVQMEDESGLDRNAALADMRYRFIESVVAGTVVHARVSREHLRSIRMDKVLTGKYTAIPVFLGVMVLVFWLTFSVIGQALSDLLAGWIDNLGEVVSAALQGYGINPVVHSLIKDGIFSGVGTVLSFLPIIVTLFFFLSVLEDTGYMARVAFVMDRLLRKIGLSGRSIVPMLIGFGCSVPAVMATRTVSSDRDRQMSLILVSLLMKNTVFRGNPVPFVMELPNYRFPSAKSVGLLLWEKAGGFLQRAFGVIFVCTLIIWFLGTFDARLFSVEDNAKSLLALIGQGVAPVFAPLGFTDWRMATALLTGFAAKETVVATTTVLTNATPSTMTAVLQGIFTPAAAASFLAFTLLYTPCVAAIATIRKELDSTLGALGVVVAQCVIAWAVGIAVYHIALFF